MVDQVVIIIVRRNQMLVAKGALRVERKLLCSCCDLSFQVLPTVIFFSSVISVCYYAGIMQVVIKKIAWLMQVTMKTSGVESLNAAGNIFVGQVLCLSNNKQNMRLLVITKWKASKKFGNI